MFNAPLPETRERVDAPLRVTVAGMWENSVTLEFTLTPQFTIYYNLEIYHMCDTLPNLPFESNSAI